MVPRLQNPKCDRIAVSKKYSCIILQHPKRWAELGASVRLTPRSALDVRKTPSLRASVGGGQISLTSVLIGGFVTCCCASSPYRPLLSVPAPSFLSSVHQKVLSGDAMVIASGAPFARPPGLGWCVTKCAGRFWEPREWSGGLIRHR